MKIKTSELTGSALAYALAKAVGDSLVFGFGPGISTEELQRTYIASKLGSEVEIPEEVNHE